VKFKLSLRTVAMTVLVLWLFVLAIPGHAQVLVQDDPDEYPWLSFVDMAEFETYMNSLLDMSDDELDVHEDSLNFYSMRRAMNEEGNPQVGNDVVYEEQDNFVEDDYLASALNPRGILQIGFDVIVVCQDIVYRVPEDQTGVIDSLDFFAEAIPPDLPPGVEAYLIERIEGTITEEQMEGAVVLATKKAKCTNEYVSKHRLKGRAWMTSWRFYASVGAKTKSQKKKKFLWWKYWKSKKVEWVKVYYHYYYTVSPSGSTLSGQVTRTRYNASSTRAVIGIYVGWGVLVNGTISSIHDLKNGTYTPQCVVRIPKP
jgi:hypothetical protein